jgi:hypothetical protein
MQAVVLEGFDEIELMAGAYRVPVMRRGAHSMDLILTRDTAQSLVYALLKRIEADDERPSNLVCFKAAG